MNVMLVLPYIRVGGVEQVTLNLVTAAQEDIRYSLATTESDEDELEHRFLPYVNHVFHVEKVSKKKIHQVRYLLNLIGAYNIHCIHINHSRLAYRALPAIKDCYPHVSIVDTLHMEEPYARWDFFRLSASYRRFLDARVVLTPSQRNRLLERYGESAARVHVIPNGIFLDDLRLTTSSDKSIVILFVGRLVPQKRPDLFLDIVEELIAEGFWNRHRDVRVMMIGKGPLQAQLNRRIERRGLTRMVKLCGSDPGLFSKLAKQNRAILVAPSVREGLPMVGLEAMALGVPIVASDVPGWNDLLDNDKNGYLVPEGSVRGFVQRITSLAECESTYKTVVSEAAETVQRYQASHMAQAYGRVYNTLVNDRIIM